ncbi:hypothetical protein ANO14919_069230 [Xylariales sp. No.14919]|nr:hypothetical protein ANO14919_069230 [Xylariales sp. No.14919]
MVGTHVSLDEGSHLASLLFAAITPFYTWMAYGAPTLQETGSDDQLALFVIGGAYAPFRIALQL